MIDHDVLSYLNYRLLKAVRSPAIVLTTKRRTVVQRSKMGHLSLESRCKVILMWRNGYPVTVIQERLLEEGVKILKVSLFTLIKKFKTTCLIADLPNKTRSSLLEECHYRFINDMMTTDNELTSRQLFALFTAEYPEVQVSISTI